MKLFKNHKWTQIDTNKRKLMLMRVYSWAIFFTGLFFMTAIAQTHANDRILNITEHTTPKGITFWHIEDHSMPIVTMHFAFENVGSVHDPIDKTGLGQLASNTIDEGAGDRDANEFQEALQNHAIDLSFSNSRDFFGGKIKTLKRHSPLAFQLLRDAIHSPRFDEEAITRMRQANITRIKSSQAKPDWMASRLMNDVYYGDHPYARNSGGTISGLQAVTADDMHGFVKDSFRRDNLVIATAGDMTAEEAMVTLDQIFGDLPTGESKPELGDITPPQVQIKQAFEKDSPQSVVQMAWPAIAKQDDDYHAYRVMNHLLGGGGFSSYLMEEVREKRGLTYGIYSMLVNMKHANYLMIESATSPENIKPMMDAIQNILSKMTTENADENLLSDAKSYLIGSLPLRFSTTLSLSGAALRMQVDGRSIDSLDRWAENISAVTADDVRRVANRVFADLEPKAIVIAGAVPSDQGFEVIDVVPGIE